MNLLVKLPDGIRVAYYEAGRLMKMLSQGLSGELLNEVLSF
jgi:hypothetical protein